MKNTKSQNVKAILSTSLFGVVNDLVKAKEDGQPLPGILDKIAGMALNAKNQGIDMAKEEAKVQSMKYIPHAIAAVLAIVLIVVLMKK